MAQTTTQADPAATKTAIITGASSGLGYECARALLRTDRSWHVVLAVRDAERGLAVADSLEGEGRCSVMCADLSSLESIRNFVAQQRSAGLPPTRALVCNAGVQVVSGASRSADGFELTFAVNHLGHFALVCGLLDQLARPARIVIVSSDTHDPERRSGMPAPRYISAEELAKAPSGPDEEATSGRRRYTTSKLCNLLFAYELDRRLGQGRSGITVNAFNPGLMPGSGLARDYPPLQRFAWRFVLPLLRFLPQVGSARASGIRLAALVHDPRFERVSGRYFDGLREVRSSKDSYDREKASDLWQTSERLAGVDGRLIR
ncbi:MAG: SDR family NAD(P)-dependent oxidoreductase [Actinobacteria bacterium]|nr:MAG: SDR family NAD(P)-dependent oxidoreductase [Actinomycetota bacterium]